MIAGHRGMVKQLRGVPGVTSEKMVEAMNPVHCALSLVGEPIMYPRIAEFLDYLHSHGLSSYLVTNAQVSFKKIFFIKFKITKSLMQPRRNFFIQVIIKCFVCPHVYL